MGESIGKILAQSQGPLGGEVTAADCFAFLAPFGPRGRELAELLSARNGWLAWHSALLVRPLTDAPPVLGVCSWNEPSLWKQSYAVPPDALFFAEDAFGDQFAIVGDRIHFFEGETGEFDDLAGSLEEWATLILEEPHFHTGWPLALEWQETNGPLPLGRRLLPKTPFVLQGEYSVANLWAGDDREGMQFRGRLANQLRDAPDGTPVWIRIGDGAGSDR